MSLWAVVLAAGEGKRMRSALPKVLHTLCGRKMVCYILESIRLLTEQQVIVVGHGGEQVEKALGDKYIYAYQRKQLGTGDALKRALPLLPEESSVLVLYGDTPLLSTDTLSAMVQAFKGKAAIVLTAALENPTGYGRIIRDAGGELSAIVEERDASTQEKAISEINAGAYVFKVGVLKKFLPVLSKDNAQGECYLTDLIARLIESGYPVAAYKTGDYREVLGVNDRCQLAETEGIMRARINEKLMRQGVTLVDPATTYIDADTTIGADTVIYPQTIIEGESTIGKGCTIGPGSHLQKVKVGDCVKILQSVVVESTIGSGSLIGPFAYIRPETVIGESVKIGDFVEVKKSMIGNKTKIPHLSYIGDAQIGEGVNLGAGIITVNFDGKHKYVTTIRDNAFIGCNSNLIAPVTIEKAAYVGAGSTITADVPAHTLALGRARQVNKKGMAKKFLKEKS